MKILLTGATGFLGSHLLRALLTWHHEVVILKRSSSDTRRISKHVCQVKLYDIDTISIESLLAIESDVDAIVHLATNYGRRSDSLQDIVSSNLIFPLTLMHEFAKLRHGVFINTDTALPRYSNYYSLSKKQLLDWGDIFSRSGDLTFVNVQLEHMYGPGDDESKFTSFVIRQCIKNVDYLELTPGDQARDFIYVDDVVNAYGALIEHEYRESYNEFELGSGRATTIRNFAEKVRELTNSDTELRFGMKPYRLNELMYSQADISKLLKIGWRPTVNLEEGIRRTVESEVLQE